MDPATHYAHIEKELLAVVYGLEKFHTYTYGRQVQPVELDHKPLEMILKKPLSWAPIQANSINLGYTVYERGPQWTWLTLWARRTCIFPIMEVKGLLQKSRPSTWYMMHPHRMLKSSTLQEIKQHTTNDKALLELIKFIKTGWPETCIMVLWNTWRTECWRWSGCQRREICGSKIAASRPDAAVKSAKAVMKKSSRKAKMNPYLALLE